VAAIALASSFALAESDMQNVGGPTGSTVVEGNVGDDNHYILECGGACSPMLANTIGPGFTGAWFDPAQSGHGLFIEILPNNRIQVAWFSFNPAGSEQAWFVGVGTYSNNSATITDVAQPTGGRWIPHFDPSRVVNNAWGTLTLTFTDCNRGKVDFTSTLGYGVGSMNLTRLTQIAGLGCPAPSIAALTTPPNWTATGDLNAPRKNHTATLLPNGKVLVVGGWNTEYPYLPVNIAELYDTQSGTWSLTGSPNSAPGDHTATLLQNDKVLVVGLGGNPPSAGSVTAELYDITTGTWSVTGAPTIPPFALGATATLLPSGNVLIAGGVAGYDYDGVVAYPIAALYDPAAATWRPTGTPSRAISGHTATLLRNGNVLVVGGAVDPAQGINPVPSKAEFYDSLSGAWREFGTDTFGIGHTATLLPTGKVLMAGEGLSGTRLYDPATETFDYTGNLTVARWAHTATLLPSGKVLLAAGFVPLEGTGRPSNSADLYDPDTGSWASTSHLNFGRWFHTATLLPNGNVLVAGGVDYQLNALKRTELYVPQPIGPSLTGAWYDPAQSGHGIFVEVLPDNQFLAAWFTFDPSGTQQSWFVGIGTYNGNTATISQVVQSTGGRWIPNFDPSHIVSNAWGSLTFTFTDCNHGKVDFVSTLGYGSGSMNLTRLTQPAGLTCR